MDTSMDAILQFQGINRKLYAGETEFNDMLNMTSDKIPYLSTRDKRKYIDEGKIILGACTHGSDMYQVVNEDGTVKFTKNNVDITMDVTLTNSKKNMFAYGAYIVIFPDKVMYNTQEVGADGNIIEEHWTKLHHERTLSRGALHFYLCDKDGNPFVFLPEIGTIAGFFTGSGGVEDVDAKLSGYMSQYISTYPGYVALLDGRKEWEKSYASNNTISVDGINFLWGSKSFIQEYSELTTYPIYFAGINKEDKIVINGYSKTNEMWSSPDMYVAIQISGVDNIYELNKNIKVGDFFKISSPYDKDDESPVAKLAKHLSNYVKVENKFYGRDGLVLIIKYTGTDYLEIIKNDKFSYGNTGKNGKEKSVNIARNYFSDFIPANKTVKIEKDVPSMDYLTVSNNRIWGCSSEKHEIYACKQGDPSQWHCYAGLASDSYAVTIGSGGDFTGACTFGQYPYFFKEDKIIGIVGSRPSNYQTNEIEYKGVAKGSDKSIAYRNSYVYFHSNDGIVRFNGASTTIVSESVNLDKHKNGIAGICGDKYYISLLNEKNEPELYVFDINNRVWHKEDDYRPDGFFICTSNLYGYKDSIITQIAGKTKDTNTYLDSNGTEEDDVRWSVESGIFDAGSSFTKHISKLMFRVSLERGASMTISLMYDSSGKWEKVATINSKQKRKNQVVPIIPRRCEHMRYKIEGIGNAVIFEMDKTIEKGSEVN